MTATVLHLPTARSLAAFDVARLTDSPTYARGVEYLRAGRVVLTDRGAHAVAATVTGTTSYVVRLAMGRHGVEHGCTCPIGADGGFCKHLVAVALAASSVDLDDDEDADDAIRRPADLVVYRGAIEHDRDEWEERADEVIDAVEDLLRRGRRADVVGFCERAVDLLEANAAEIRDDVAVRHLAARLTDLRERATRSA